MNTKFLLLFLLLPLGISWANQTDTPIYKLDDFVVKSSPLSLNESEKTQATTVLASKALDALKSETIAQTLIQQHSNETDTDAAVSAAASTKTTVKTVEKKGAAAEAAVPAARCWQK